MHIHTHIHTYKHIFIHTICLSMCVGARAGGTVKKRITENRKLRIHQMNPFNK